MRRPKPSPGKPWPGSKGSIPTPGPAPRRSKGERWQLARVLTQSWRCFRARKAAHELGHACLKLPALGLVGLAPKLCALGQKKLTSNSSQRKKTLGGVIFRSISLVFGASDLILSRASRKLSPTPGPVLDKVTSLIDFSRERME